MASLTTFLRLESHPEGDDIGAGLQSRVFDAAWLLARQWQTGEFLGEDSGSPVMARWRAETSAIDRYRLGPAGGTVNSYSLGLGPLEALVEQPTPATSWTAVESAQAGQEFLQRLQDSGLIHYAAAYRAVYPFAALSDPSFTTAQQRFLRLMAGRVPDANRLATDLVAAFAVGTLPARPVIAPGDALVMGLLTREWLAWAQASFTQRAQQGPAWAMDRLAYDFAVAGPIGSGELILEATNHPGGAIDWFSFDCQAPPAAGATSTPTAVVSTLLPAQLRFRGMPLPRWWTFEDGGIDYGVVDAGAADLAKLIFLEFALLYSNDFFLIPVSLPLGSLCRTDSLVVTDTFGVRILVPPAAQSPVGGGEFTLFTLNGAPSALGDTNLFLLPPVALQPVDGGILEQVDLLRDEMANLDWAVEHRALDSFGFQRVRDEDARRLVPPPPNDMRTPGAGAPAPLTYQLSSSVPPQWYPLVPIQTPAGVRLSRGSMLAADGSIPHPIGTLLTLPFVLHEEEVPREGAVMQRTAHTLRWLGAVPYSWTSWRKTIGRGEGSSGLCFDQVVS